MIETFKRMVRWIRIEGLTEDMQVGQSLLAATLIMAVILLVLNFIGPGL